MKKKRKYVGENLKWFLDFLPDDVYDSLSNDDKLHYREYRRFQRFIGEGNLRIEKLQKQIDLLQNKIREERIKIKGVDSEHSSWNEKMKIHYNHINHLHKDFTFGCSISRRDRSSKSQKLKDGKLRNLKENELPIEKESYKGKEITKNYLWYSRVENSKFRCGIYLGKEEKIRTFLGELYNEDWSKDDIEDLRSELRGILSQYTRYKVFNSNWETFDDETHNLKSVSDWCKKMGDKRYEWGGMKG
jgi:hypothetical protein